jgi:uncharacterized membrane protein SirB2
VIFVLYAVVALISLVGAIWGFYSYLSPADKATPNIIWLVMGIACVILFIVCGGLFLSSRVNKTEEIHITE